MKTPWLAALLLVGCAQAPPEPRPVPPPPKPEPVVTPTETKPAPPAPLESNRIHPLKDLATAKLSVNGKPIRAWIMDEDGKRQEGMMFLQAKDVAPDQGMLFVFPDAQPRSFWMQNTFIPLDIVYIGADRKVVSISRGKPHDETPLPSDGPAQYVLELAAGGAKRFGIQPKTLVQIPAELKSKD